MELTPVTLGLATANSGLAIQEPSSSNDLEARVLTYLSKNLKPLTPSKLTERLKKISVDCSGLAKLLETLFTDGKIKKVTGGYLITDSGRTHLQTLPVIKTRKGRAPGSTTRKVTEPVEEKKVINLTPEELKLHILAALFKTTVAKKPWEIDSAIQTKVKQISPGAPQNPDNFRVTVEALSTLYENGDVDFKIHRGTTYYILSDQGRNKAEDWLKTQNPTVNYLG